MFQILESVVDVLNDRVWSVPAAYLEWPSSFARPPWRSATVISTRMATLRAAQCITSRIFVVFVFVGAVAGAANLEIVWKYGDLALGLMTVPNLIAVLLLSPRVVQMTKDYFSRLPTEAPNPK